MKSWHMVLCAVVAVVGLALVIAGSAWALIPALVCGLMLGAMLMMARGGTG